MSIFATMSGNRMLRRGTLMAATLAVLALSACATTGGTDAAGQPSASGTAFNQADVQFAQMMIMHHEQAVQMATLAQTRATDPQLKQLAAQIKAAQEPEITTMAGWLTAWGQPTAQPSGHSMSGMSGIPGMMSESEMTELARASGVEFDRMFARMMIAHHSGAIQMCRELQGTGQHSGAKSLAATVEQTQAAEVATLQTILDRL